MTEKAQAGETASVRAALAEEPSFIGRRAPS